MGKNTKVPSRFAFQDHYSSLATPKYLTRRQKEDDTRGTRTLNLCHRKATPYH